MNVLITSAASATAQIIANALAGTHTLRLTDLPGNEYNTAWSADGKKVVWVEPDSEGNHTVWVADADGSNARRITNIEG